MNTHSVTLSWERMEILNFECIKVSAFLRESVLHIGVLVCSDNNKVLQNGWLQWQTFTHSPMAGRLRPGCQPGWFLMRPPPSPVCRRPSSCCVLMWPYLCTCPACSLLFLSPKVVSSSLQPHVLQHARLPCPSLSPRVAQIHVSWVSGTPVSLDQNLL